MNEIPQHGQLTNHSHVLHSPSAGRQPAPAAADAPLSRRLKRPERRNILRLLAGMASLLGLIAFFAGPLAGDVGAETNLAGPVGPDDFRISAFGPDGNPQFDTQRPIIAANPHAGQYIVVWEGRSPGNNSDIYARRIDTATGQALDAADIPISAVGPLPYVARRPDVVYNAHDKQYLVVWYGDTAGTGNDVIEVFGQRLDGETGLPIGERLVISQADAYPALAPKVTYNATHNEYLVAWIGTGPADSGYEVYARHLDAATGQKLGASEFRVSEMGPDNLNGYPALGVDLVFNPVSAEYLVVWSGIHSKPNNMALGEVEIYGQRLQPDGSRFGPLGFRMSYMGETGDADYIAGHPSVAFNSRDNQYLVVWTGEDNSGGLVDGEYEIWGGRIRPGPDYVQITNLRLSQTGGQGDTAWSALDPDVSYDSDSNEYLIVWSADAANPVPAVADDFEIYGARLAPDQNTIPEPFVLSEMGAAVEDPTGRANQPAVAFDKANKTYLVAWRGDEGQPPLVDEEYEIFGQLYMAAPAQPQPTPTPPPGSSPTPEPTPTPQPSPTPEQSPTPGASPTAQAPSVWKHFVPHVSR